jgi:peptidyl-prolyl cis-trans isomerase A (cyclophilin A)
MNRSIFLAGIAATMIFASCSNDLKINGESVTLEEGIYAKIETTEGDILIKFETENAPMTSANFIMLAEGTHPDVSEDYKGKKYFDGLTFHRCMKDFMIQGGDPMGTGMGGPGYQFPNEVSENLKHNKGVVSMANSGPHTNGSQFFITVADVNFLDGGYSVFASVIAGLEIAEKITELPQDAQNKPDADVVMKKVTIIRKGADFKNWDAEAAFNKGKEDFEAAQMRKAEEAVEAAKAQVGMIAEKYPTAITSPSGLRYIIQEVGKGKKPADGDMVDVHYAGYFLDGTLFDTSIEKIAKENGLAEQQVGREYIPMPVKYGPEAQLIPGFVEGMSLLNIGGKATIIIPPGLAYGDRDNGPIPANSWLIFDIELVK